MRVFFFNELKGLGGTGELDAMFKRTREETQCPRALPAKDEIKRTCGGGALKERM